MAFPSNPINGQIYKSYVFDSTIMSWKNISTAMSNDKYILFSDGTAMQKSPSSKYFIGGSTTYTELFELNNSGRNSTAGRFSLTATRGNFVHASNNQWISNHNGVPYASLIRQVSNYSPVPIAIDVDVAGNIIVSATWGAGQGYSITAESFGADYIDYSYAGANRSSPATGYTRYIFS